MHNFCLHFLTSHPCTWVPLKDTKVNVNENAIIENSATIVRHSSSIHSLVIHKTRIHHQRNKLQKILCKETDYWKKRIFNHLDGFVTAAANAIFLSFFLSFTLSTLKRKFLCQMCLSKQQSICYSTRSSFKRRTILIIFYSSGENF